MRKSKVQDDIVRVAVETALEVYAKEKQKERRRRADRRLRDTKRLMRNYREIKIHAGNAIASLTEVVNDDYEFFHNLMSDGDKIDVEAIVRSKAKSAIMLAHVDAMLQVYQIMCYGSVKPEDQRRYRVLEARYLIETPLPVHKIAEQENIDTRTVYKDIDVACEKMSALLFGIQWMERD